MLISLEGFHLGRKGKLTLSQGLSEQTCMVSIDLGNNKRESIRVSVRELKALVKAFEG